MTDLATDSILTLQQVEEFLIKAGKKGADTLSILGRLSKTISEVLHTDVGIEIMYTDIQRMDMLLMKIVNETSTEMERAEFRYLKNVRIPWVADKLKKYLDAQETVARTLNR